MAGRVALRPRSRPALSVMNVDDPATQRAIEQTQDAVQVLQSERKRVAVMTDLIVGTNVIRHQLGRDVVGYTLTPTVADATFAHAIDETNPRPDLELWITIVGAAQPRARIEVW